MQKTVSEQASGIAKESRSSVTRKLDYEVQITGSEQVVGIEKESKKENGEVGIITHQIVKGILELMMQLSKKKRGTEGKSIQQMLKGILELTMKVRK